MISLVFAGVGILIAFYLGVWYTEKKYEKIIKEKQDSYAISIKALKDLHLKEYRDLNKSWEKHCKSIITNWHRALMSEQRKYKQLEDKSTNIQAAWISVDERLPERGGYYLTCQSSRSLKIQVLRWQSEDGSWRGAQVGAVMQGVTHWMPLPESPKGEAENDS